MNIKKDGDMSVIGSTDATAWIQTYSGMKFFPLKPSAESILLVDIAHALSNNCRWTGHVREFYSVAQHSVIVSRRAGLLAMQAGFDREYTLHVQRKGLMHDGSEAYISDMARPTKHHPRMGGYLEIEKVLQDAIDVKFGLDTGDHPLVKKADNEVLFTEARDLLGPKHADWVWFEEPLTQVIEPLSPREARSMFLAEARLLGLEPMLLGLVTA